MFEKRPSRAETEFRMLIWLDQLPSYSLVDSTHERYQRIAAIRDQVVKVYSQSERNEIRQIVWLKEEFKPLLKAIDTWDVDDFVQGVRAAYSRILSSQQEFESIQQVNGSRDPVSRRSFRFSERGLLHLRTYKDGSHAVGGFM